MMQPASALLNEWGGLLLIIVAGAMMTEPWRWAGVRLSRDIDIDSALFQWVRAVSTALVAGLVTRLLIFPTGQLASVDIAFRLIAFAGGLTAFFLLGRRLSVGVLSASTVLFFAAWLTS
ncbi:MAG: AzlD domain-containing protein [Pseudomonadota bacterium]